MQSEGVATHRSVFASGEIPKLELSVVAVGNQGRAGFIPRESVD